MTIILRSQPRKYCGNAEKGTRVYSHDPFIIFCHIHFCGVNCQVPTEKLDLNKKYYVSFTLKQPKTDLHKLTTQTAY